ncbi:MAG: hypothetical protein AAGG50_17770 [Bacteroidota bacterium]
MRYASLLALIATLLFAAGCATVADPVADDAPAPPPSETAAEVRARAVQTAVRTAFGLEASLFENPEAIASHGEVVTHFRHGFVDALAQDFADYYWQRDRVQTGPPTLLVPASVTVLRSTERTAAAFFETPAALRATWDLPRYTLVQMRREGDRWLVASTSQQERRPS